MKSIRLEPVPIALLFLVAFAAGALSVWAVTSLLANDNEPASSQSPPEGFHSKSQSMGDAAGSDLDLRSVARVKSDFARSLALWKMAESANEYELADLLSQSIEVEPASLRAEMQVPIVKRLATIDPELALTHIERLPDDSHADLVSAVFGEWSRTALDEAISFANGLEKDMQILAFEGIVESGHGLNGELRAQIAERIGGEVLTAQLLNPGTLLTPIENPREAWQQLVQQSAGTLGNVGALIDIANAWVRKDGLNVLQEIRKATLHQPEMKWVILGSVLFESAKREPRETFEHTLSMQGHERNSFAVGAARSWAESDWMAALTAVNDVDDTLLRVHLLQEVLRQVAGSNPGKLLANLEDLPTNVQEIAQEHALIGTAIEDPQGAARLLETHNVATSSVANSIVDYWSESNPLEALDWVLSSPILEEKRRELAVRVIDRLAREQTDLAMKLALEQPTEWGLEAHVISTVAHSDAFEAMKLLPQLRDPAVAFPYDAIGYSLIEQGHAKSVLDVAKQVPEQTREAFYSNMTSNWAVHDPLGLLGMIDDLPTSSMRSKAAYALSSQYHAINTLSDEQIELAKTYLNEWDLQRLDKSQTHFRFVGASQEIRFAGTPDQVEFLMTEINKLMDTVKSENSTD